MACSSSVTNSVVSFKDLKLLQRFIFPEVVLRHLPASCFDYTGGVGGWVRRG